MKIGLVGESPNDTGAIRNLLEQKYHSFEFVELLRGTDGSMLDNRKAMKLIRREFEIQKPDMVIFIRDLDSHENDKIKKRERQKTFSACNRIVNKTAIQLLHVYEIEALILADIEVFNEEYGCDIKKPDDPMKVPDPKEFLLEACRKTYMKYSVGHNPYLFRLLKFDTLKRNCRYFSAFIRKFNKAVL